MIKEIRSLSTGSEQTSSNTLIVRNDTNRFCFYDCDFDVFIPEFKPVFGQGA